MKQSITLAAGCFWGVQEYYRRLKGVLHTEVGYANGITKNPTYEDVCKGNTHFAEVTKIVFDSQLISLASILDHFYRIVDPTTLNQQGNDIGTQYRSGIYYEDAHDLLVINQVTDAVKDKYQKPLVVEIEPLHNYFNAENYHQDYLIKNPSGYCHVDFSLINEDERK